MPDNATCRVDTSDKGVEFVSANYPDDPSVVGPCLGCQHYHLKVGEGVCRCSGGKVSNETSCACINENGLYTSLVTAAIALPIIGVLNLAFGWLRMPMHRDVAAKSGELFSALSELRADGPAAQLGGAPSKGGSDAGAGAAPHVYKRPGLVRRFWRCLKKQPCLLRNCITVQWACVRSSCVHRVHPVNQTAPEILSEPAADTEATTRSSLRRAKAAASTRSMPRGRVQPCQRRVNLAHQMRVSENYAARLFDSYDLDHNGVLDRTELADMMQGLNNGGQEVDDAALDFVLNQASDVPLEGSQREVHRDDVAQAITVWCVCVCVCARARVLCVEPRLQTRQLMGPSLTTRLAGAFLCMRGHSLKATFKSLRTRTRLGARPASRRTTWLCCCSI